MKVYWIKCAKCGAEWTESFEDSLELIELKPKCPNGCYDNSTPKFYYDELKYRSSVTKVRDNEQL